MSEINYKELFAQPLKDLMYANAIEKEWHRRRVQTRLRPDRSGDVEYTPFEEIGDQNHDEVRPGDSSRIETGDTG